MAATDGEPNCTASSLDWASLILTMLAVNVNWWLFHIPLIWQKGFKAYSDKVMWQCVRSCIPAFAAVAVLKQAGTDKTLWPSIYYLGPEGEYAEWPQKMTRFKYAKALVTDTKILIATIMSVVQFCQMSPDGDFSGLNSSTWTFPALPMALYGILFLIGSRLPMRRRYIIIGGIFVLAVVLVALVLTMRFGASSDRGLWYPAMMMFLYSTIPVALVPSILGVMVILYGGLNRVLGVAIGAMSERAYFPYCQLKNDTFGGIYLGFGLLAGVLALIGSCKWYPFPWSHPGLGGSTLTKEQREGYKRIGRGLQVSLY